MDPKNAPSRTTGSSIEPGKSESYRTRRVCEDTDYPVQTEQVEQKYTHRTILAGVEDSTHPRRSEAGPATTVETTIETKPRTTKYFENPSKLNVFEEAVGAEFMGFETSEDQIVVTFRTTWKAVLPASAMSSLRDLKVGNAVGILLTDNPVHPIRLRRLG